MAAASQLLHDVHMAHKAYSIILTVESVPSTMGHSLCYIMICLSQDPLCKQIHRLSCFAPPNWTK